MRKLRVTWLSLLVVLFVASTAWGTSLAYLDPLTIPVGTQYNDYAYLEASDTVNFSGVLLLEVMPAYDLDGTSLYSTLGSDFTGNVDGAGAGWINFATAAPYGVRVTYTDNSQEYFYYGVDTLDRPNPPGNPPPAVVPPVRIPTPTPDIVIVDSNDYKVRDEHGILVTENLVNSDPDYPAGTTEVAEDSWADVLTYLQGLPAGANKHVELGGHGSAGELYWGGALVLDSSSLNQLDALKGKVNNLTFMSCKTGADGDFIQKVADKLGESSGYTQSVGGNGTDWFIWNNGTKVTKVIPEPMTMLAVGLGLAGLGGYIRKRRAA